MCLVSKKERKHDPFLKRLNLGRKKTKIVLSKKCKLKGSRKERVYISGLRKYFLYKVLEIIF